MDDLYDEFGNPVTDDIGFDGSVNSYTELEENLIYQELVRTEDVGYEEEVDVLLETEDREAENPILPADRNVEFRGLTKNLPKVSFDREYLLSLMKIPERQLNIGIYGPLHSGKTSFVDLFALDTHRNLPGSGKKVRDGWRPLKYMDCSNMERERGISLKLNGMTFAYESSKSRTYAVTMLDTPGHVNFWDDVGISLATCEYGILVIDVVEGVTSICSKLIKELYEKKIKFIVVFNKIDRLILEMKLPPLDAYLKLQHLVDNINTFTEDRYSPELGNILFSSTKYGFVFSIESFVTDFYSHQLKNKSSSFIDRLWGQVNYRNGMFYQSDNLTEKITFVQFILAPIYKIFTHSLSKSPTELDLMLKTHFGVTLSSNILSKDPQPLLYHVFRSIFPKYNTVVDQLGKFSPQIMTSSSNVSDVHVHVVRHMNVNGEFWSLCHVINGSVNPGDELYIFTESSAHEYDHNEEEVPLIRIGDLALLGGSYTFKINHASIGQLVLMKGFEDKYTKSAFLCQSKMFSFSEIDYLNEPVLKIAVQPQKASELPLLLKGLHEASCFYPSLLVKVEESGENVLVGTGELQMDCLMEELRKNFCRIEIKVSQPMIQLAEACAGESVASIPVNSGNEVMSISVMAEPLNRNIVHDVTHGKIDPSELKNIRKFSKRLRDDYGWDSLSARNVWALSKCNVFIDDTLPDEVDKELLKNYKQYMIQGFEWAVKEGPLCEENIHACQFKLLDFRIKFDADKDIVPSQLVPMTRKACYIAMMTANPILMEPIYEVHILVHGILQSVVETLVKRRRGGRIYGVQKIVGTPLVEMKTQLPVIETVGFETDLRQATNGAGMCQSHFWNKIWRRVPGDVLDEKAFIPKLKPAPNSSLSRDFVMKTRRRKGLSQSGHLTQDGPSLQNFVDHETYETLRQNGLI